ncbi:MULTISPECIES: aminopeptidase [Oceanobacillus]|uniref:Aminopeptidase n=1 Tax=Oceanobacillus kimchii TaxID=746691 RepID=A0ABQ5TIJ0_9BACI|nr:MULTISPECIES: aminopeptidase [Oceanobacillus]MBT2598615.1 aminopeptidase [Oceanobacillus sp. ISL-74]MBT2651534.1 aminopeptidase [Oceanobacillus sp. ISL-73]GLO66091.1 aminopeptidase [Oceanobacillus kimchii]
MIKGIYEFISEAQLKKYAELAVRAGVNLQQNQLLIIHSDIQNATFARLIQMVAYEAGASNVFIDWTDEQSTKEFYLNAANSVIDHFPDWQAARFKEWDDEGGAYIHIVSENLDAFKDVSTERMSRFQKASRTKLKAHYAKTRSHEIRWCLLAVPHFTWATKVFPHLIKEEALQSLWQLILRGARADGENLIKDWENHDRNLQLRKKNLNDSQFETLHFTNSRGTDLSVGMPKNHLYIGGGVIDKNGIPFFPNIPTEEIFTAPHKNKVNGKLVGTKPLIYGGSVIDEFYLIFKDGRITDYNAAKGKEVLQNLIETDEGSHYLGEIALVSNKSPLAQADTLFYNTLFDENTACHIGIGNASPSNIQNGIDQSEEELKAAGLNTSLLLVNVTFGTEDMKVVGIKEGGTEVLLMNDGDFQF